MIYGNTIKSKNGKLGRSMPNGGGQHYALATLLPGNSHVANLIGGWTYFERFGKKKSLDPTALRTPDHPGSNLVNVPTTLSRLHKAT